MTLPSVVFLVAARGADLAYTYIGYWPVGLVVFFIKLLWMRRAVLVPVVPCPPAPISTTIFLLVDIYDCWLCISFYKAWGCCCCLLDCDYYYYFFPFT